MLLTDKHTPVGQHAKGTGQERVREAGGLDHYQLE